METKICSLCKQKLDKSLFYKKKKSNDKLRSECKECSKEVAKARYNTDTDKAKACAKAWRDANPDKRKAMNRALYAANPEKRKTKNNAWRDANPEKAKAAVKAWAKANPEVVNINNQTRRSRKAELASTLTQEQWIYILDAFNNSCAYCETGYKALHQEHFVALSKGGGYDATNIIPACQSCNCSKGAKNFFTWYPTFKHYSKQREEKIMNFLHYTGEKQQLTLCT